MTRRTILMALAVTMAATLTGPARASTTGKAPCAALPATMVAGQRPRVQLALLLDTSNSMDGLIDQARSQLWSVVNQFAAARRCSRSRRSAARSTAGR
jgi:hypothetical protein